LKKWADFSNVSLQRLIKSFEDTPIYEEALKEVFTKDLDLEKLVYVIEKIRKGEIKLQKVETGGNATPIARASIERVSMKTDLIPPERMRLVLIESMKARLLNEVGTLLCTSCWSYTGTIRVKEMADEPKCPACGSNALGLLRVEEEKILPIVEKKGEKLTKSEEKLQKQALQAAQLIAKYGKAAALALCIRKVHIPDVIQVLKEESKPTDRFYEMLLEAERKAISKSFR